MQLTDTTDALSLTRQMIDIPSESGNEGPLADAVEALMESMGMPTRLGQLGVREENLEHITKVGLGAAIIQLTPAVMNEQTVYALLKGIL